MGLLDNLFGGDQERRSDFDSFVNRYQQGPPHDGYDDREVYDRYRQVAPNLSPADYEDAARASFERMSPQERIQFGRSLQQTARQQGFDFGGFPDYNQDGIDDRLQDPNYLARMTGQMQQRQPGLLEGLLGGAMGGGMGGGMGSMMGGGGMGGGMMSGGMGRGSQAGSMLNNPVARAAMAGIAAMAVRKMMDRR